MKMLLSILGQCTIFIKTIPFMGNFRNIDESFF